MVASTSWNDLANLAPHTKAVWETAAHGQQRAVLEFVHPVFDFPISQASPEWGDFLNSYSQETKVALTQRELILRWLLTRAIVDQGSDIEGVEIWHDNFILDCYAAGIRILHEPEQAIRHYDEVVGIAHANHEMVTAQRALVWASLGANRNPNAYTPYNVDGLRGGKQSHWFVSARFLPGLLTSLVNRGGLTEIVFGRSSVETPSEMSQRLRDDRLEGLGFAIGDKAADLFAKWSVGTFNLGAGLDILWRPEDCPLPMDQRVGRILMRVGFMDEFFGVSRALATKSWGFTNPSNPSARRPVHGEDLGVPGWHLRVTQFRQNGRVSSPELRAWLNSESARLDAPASKSWTPQNVASLLCRSLNDQLGTNLTPVVLDDYFMHLAADDGCRDLSPVCATCDVSEHCQANNSAGYAILKTFFT